MSLTHQQEQMLHDASARAAIAELTARHNRAYEDGDVDGWRDTFSHRAPEYVRDGQEFDRGSLREAFDAWKGRIHVCTDAVVEVDGVRATQRCRFLVGQPSADGTQFQVDAVGRYEDELVYERGAWYLARRVATTDAGSVG